METVGSAVPPGGLGVPQALPCGAGAPHGCCALWGLVVRKVEVCGADNLHSHSRGGAEHSTQSGPRARCWGAGQGTAEVPAPMEPTGQLVRQADTRAWVGTNAQGLGKSRGLTLKHRPHRVMAGQGGAGPVFPEERVACVKSREGHWPTGPVCPVELLFGELRELWGECEVGLERGRGGDGSPGSGLGTVPSPEE